MLKLGKLPDYATLLMARLAAQPDRLHTAHALADETGVARPTVSQLLKRLAREGLLEAQRGAHGGYRLARPAEAISVADIVTALDGPIGLTDCATHAGGCTLESNCGVRHNWRLIGDAIRRALESVTLAQMALPMSRVQPLRPMAPVSAPPPRA